MNDLRMNWLDKFINVISPAAYANRLRARAQTNLIQRQYDAAKSPSGQSKIQSNSNSANKELNKNIAPVRENARELVRNQPVATKAVSVLVNETISWGIEPTITHAKPEKQDEIRNEFRAWAKICGSRGEDFYSLQNLSFSAMVVDGEGLGRQVIVDKRVKIDLIEADNIDTKKDNAKYGKLSLENGIVMDDFKRPHFYMLLSGKESIPVPQDQIIHLFRKDRVGQNRGISWLAPVASTIWTLDQINYAQLNKQLLGSALTAFVTKQPTGLSPDLDKQQAEDDWSLTTGGVHRLNPGESITLPTTPNDSGFDPQFRNTLRLIASGLGITYEALSSDLSQVNFSSARIGQIQQRKNIDAWRYHVVIPCFCEKAFQWFLKDCNLRGIDTEGVEVEWTPPAHVLIDPESEIKATNLAVRSGLQAFPDALRELGFDPETHMKKIAESNRLLDKYALILESDPRVTGNGQLVNSDALKTIQEMQSKTK